jgi:hypothetical protein
MLVDNECHWSEVLPAGLGMAIHRNIDAISCTIFMEVSYDFESA